MSFDFEPKLLQDWTTESAKLRAASLHLGENWRNRLGGTALYDSVYTAVREQFANKDANTTGTANVILLFSDGEDSQSHVRIRDVVDICQQTNTRIYVFSPALKVRFGEGQKNLRALAEGNGGRVFYDVSAADTLNDLRMIEDDLRNSYLIVYKPSDLKDDGKFHAIRLTSPTRGGQIITRNGYYAPQPRR